MAARSLIALDEGAGPDEGLPQALADRLGCSVDLDDVPLSAPIGRPSRAARRVGGANLPEDAAERLTHLAARLGIASLRAPLFALAAARASAALRGATPSRRTT